MEVESRSSNNYHLEEIKSSPNDDFTTKLDQSIKQIIKSEGFIKYNINKECVSTNGGNYLSFIYEIDVKGSTKDGEKEINIFVKNAITIGSFQVISITEVYNSELFAYKKLSKIFAELQENANVPMEERFKMVKVYDESNTEAILMENMARRGFTTFHRMDSMPLKFVEISVKHLARFHALSFVLREKTPEYFNKKIKPLKHLMIFNDDWIDMVAMTGDTILQHIDEEYKDKLQKIYKDLPNKYAECLSNESIKACLCHGDYRANNILIKIDAGDIQDIIPVDYQLIYYGCPVIDFLYLIYTGTDRDFRQAHMSNLKDLYYDTLSNFLKYFDLDANTVYSRKHFEKMYTESLEFGLICGLLAIPFIFASENHLIDMSKEKSNTSIQLDDRFKKRFRGIMEDYEEFGFI